MKKKYYIYLQDERISMKNLRNIVENVMIRYNKTNHFDTIIGERTENLFTKPALTVINKYNNF